MFPVQDLYLAKKFADWLWNAFRYSASVRAEIRMVDESFAADLQCSSQFAEVRLDEFAPQMYKRVETEYEIHGSIGNHR